MLSLTHYCCNCVNCSPGQAVWPVLYFNRVHFGQTRPQLDYSLRLSVSIQKEVGSRLPSRAPLSNRSLFTESPTNKHRCTSSTRGWTQGLNIMSTVCGTVCLAQRPYYPIKIKAILTSCNYSRHKRQEIVHLSRWKKEDKKGTKTGQHHTNLRAGTKVNLKELGYVGE